MKKHFLAILFALVSCGLSAQEWNVPVEGEWFFELRDVVTVDKGDCVLGIGCTRTEDGYVARVTKEGDCLCKEVHLPGMMLDYFTAVQLDNGNYMVFGVCDDSLCDYNFQKYLRVDVFDSQLEFVSSRVYDVDDDMFDYFSYPRDGNCMRSIVTKAGTAVLAARLSFPEETFYGINYRNAMRFYEFDNQGDTVRTVDNPFELADVGTIKEITYEPHSDNLMLVVQGGNYGYDYGTCGVFVADTGFNIVAHQSMLHLGGAEYIADNASDGMWFDGDRLIVDGKQYIGSFFTYHTLYIVDSALNVYADLRLPPYDTCTEASYGTNTAYINDSTVFVFSFSGNNLYFGNEMQVNVTLVDKHLNLLGRKVIKRDNVIHYVSPPAAFNDGGCAVFMYSSNGLHYPGDPFRKFNVVKFRREDIEITWDVVQEQEAIQKQAHASAYPNPAKGTVNIPIGQNLLEGARFKIFDVRGVKCFDHEIDRQGNLITLDVSNLETGMYVYQVVSGGNAVTQGKFMKE